MKRRILHEPFDIIVKELTECPNTEQRQSFFMLAYIMAGTGTQRINGHTFQYKPGHMFLMTPEDCHSFHIDTATTFVFIRFNDIFLKQPSAALPPESVERLGFILRNASHQPGCILRNQTDKSLVRPMIEAMLRERINQDLYNRELVQHLVNTLILVVARNIAKFLPVAAQPPQEEKAADILHYVQANILHPEKLKAEHMAEHFGISATYLGRYFRKHTQETLQAYITQLRLKLIETHLAHSSMRISEIASEMGFTDESHLNKFFRKGRGASPTAYRAQAQAQR